MRILLFSSLFLLLLFSACRSTDVTGSEYDKLRSRSARFLLKQMEEHQLNYEWYSLKTKIFLKSPEERAQFIAYIRMVPDSIIWLTVRKLSIEGMRARITPDTIEILDMRNSRYLKKPFSYVRNELGIPLEFKALQELLAGNLAFYENRAFEANVDKGLYQLRTEEAGFKGLIWLNPRNYQTEKVNITDGKGQTIWLYNTDFQEVEGQTTAFQRVFELINEKKERVEIRLQTLKLSLSEEKRTPFDIPRSYTEVEELSLPR